MKRRYRADRLRTLVDEDDNLTGGKNKKERRRISGMIFRESSNDGSIVEVTSSRSRR
jgi:hypothetical protein